MNLVHITATTTENWNELDVCPTFGFQSFSEEELDFYREFDMPIEEFLCKCLESMD
jgi:hypothetical protein